MAETTLREIEWSPSRTGLINPVAVFEPVALEGTTVSRASVHNLNILEDLQLGEGDRITVYKANMIIPQVADNLTRSGCAKPPVTCPVCGGKTQIHQTGETKSLYCMNPDCQVKKIKSFALFVSRDALNIDGLSEVTLEKWIGAGLIHSFGDIFHLEEKKETIVAMEGFGEKSFLRLQKAIEQAKTTTLPRLLYGLGIAGIGAANAKLLCRAFDHDLEKIRQADKEELMRVDGIGEVLAEGIWEYFADEKKQEQLDRLLTILTLEKPDGEKKRPLMGQVIVITGSLNHFANRQELQEKIEEAGGKVTGSVTAKTTCLINNNPDSISSKNRKARELNIPIYSEEEFLKHLEE